MIRRFPAYNILFIVFCLLFSVNIGALFAQEEGDTAAYRPVTIDNADNGYAVSTENGMVRHLSGNIRLRQDSTFFYGDSAVLSREKLRFWSNIIIQQNDTTAIFSDSLIYSIRKKKAVLYDDVALKNGSRELFTDSLVYFMRSKRAHYDNGALLTDGKAVMRSVRGMYDADKQIANFRDSVQVKHEKFYLRSSALRYRTNFKRAEFVAPTFIVQDSADIYTEDGYYDMDGRELALTKNAQYSKGAVHSSADSMLMKLSEEIVHLVGTARYGDEDLQAKGDYIRYNNSTNEAYISGNAHIKTARQEMLGEELWFNNETKELQTRGRSVVRDSTQFMVADTMNFSNRQEQGRASGRVQWRDTSEQLEIRSAMLLRPNKKEMRAYGGRPLFLSELDEDSLYITSDTLHRFVSGPDSTEHLAAFYDVRIYKKDLQASSDSLHYSAADSVFVLTGSPMMWSDTTQMNGDTMYVYLKNNTIQRVKMVDNAMIISTPDYLFYNQIQGKTITAWFEDGKVDYVDVEGNAQAVYYLLDEQDAYSGVNKTESSSMRIDFKNQQITTIRFRNPNPKGTIHPMGSVNHEKLRLEGFRWLEEARPKSLDDLKTQWIVDGLLDPLDIPGERQ